MEEVPWVLNLVERKPHENFKTGSLNLFWSRHTNSLVNLHDFYMYNNLMAKAQGSYTTATGDYLDLPQPQILNAHRRDKEAQEVHLDNIVKSYIVAQNDRHLVIVADDFNKQLSYVIYNTTDAKPTFWTSLKIFESDLAVPLLAMSESHDYAVLLSNQKLQVLDTNSATVVVQSALDYKQSDEFWVSAVGSNVFIFLSDGADVTVYKADTVEGTVTKEHTLDNQQALYVSYLDEEHFVVCTPKSLLIYHYDYTLHREDKTYDMFYGESTSCYVTKNKVSVKNQFGVFDIIVSQDSSE